MPYFRTSQEWLDQTILLLEARPDSTSITAKHTIKPVRSRSDPSEKDTSKPPRAYIVLKTFDPQSGVVLKYKTNKAAEVGRLMGASLGRAGRGMGGLGEEKEDVKMADVDANVSKGDGDAAPVPAVVATGPNGKSTAQQGAQTGGGGGGGKKKKRGKK